MAFLSAAALCSALLTPGAQAHGEQGQTQEKAEDVVRVESELMQTDVMVFDQSGKFVIANPSPSPPYKSGWY
jgi:hypothetical protein